MYLNREKRNKEIADLVALNVLPLSVIAKRYRLSIGSICVIAKVQGVSRNGKHAESTKHEPKAHSARNAAIAKRVADMEETLEVIGNDYGLTKERVRQIAKMHGVSRNYHSALIRKPRHYEWSFSRDEAPDHLNSQ